jgi:hypothetical protein
MSRVAARDARTLSRSSGWMREDSSSKVIMPELGTPHKSCARSSMVNTSVSTFQAHRETPAASVATRSCQTSHSNALVRWGDISGFHFQGIIRGALSKYGGLLLASLIAF